MKTASEYLSAELPDYDNVINSLNLFENGSYTKQDVINVIEATINLARKEAIEECARTAEANYEIDDDKWELAVVDTASITKLIRDLK